MQLKDIVVGDVYLYGCFESFVEAELVKVLQIYDGKTPDRDVLLKTLDDDEEFRGYSTAIMSLEKADHELWLTIRQAETLRQEIKNQLNEKYNSNFEVK